MMFLDRVRERASKDRGFPRFSIVTILIAITLLLAPEAGATTRTKANNATNLNLTGSWSGGVVPGSGDIALWDSTVTAANTVSLGADLNFGQIQITNPGGTVTINAGNTLTLSGVSGVGIDMSSADWDLRVNCDIDLASPQTWASGIVSLVVGGNISNGGNLLSLSGQGLWYFNGLISGTGGLTTSPAGFVLQLNNPANTYTGVTTIESFALVTSLANINTASSIGKGSVAGSAADLVLGGHALLRYGGSAAASTDRLFTLGDANGLTATIDTIVSDLSFTNTGAIAFGGVGARQLNLNMPNFGSGLTLTFAPVVGDGPGGATSLQVQGTGGKVVLTGANTYTGITTVSGGTLSLDNNGTTTPRLAGTTNITVNSGGTLLLAGTNTSTDRINDAATVTLDGGTLNTGGLSEHGASNNTAGIGSLTLQSSSIIDMATGTSILAFANSSANSAAWGIGKSLDIWNWTGTPITGGGTDQLYFGSDVTGLTASQLLEIHFYSGAGTGLYGGPTGILANGEVVPIPESSTWIAGALAFAGLVFAQQRRFVRNRKA